MTSYFDHNAHITRRDKKESTTSLDVVDLKDIKVFDNRAYFGGPQKFEYSEIMDSNFWDIEHTYNGKKAGER